MATIRLVLGLPCITHPFLADVGVSLSLCMLGLGLIVSAFFAGVGADDAHELDFSQ
ncbi:MAG: hypothetical protein K0R53_353 [Burkholderiales bacterium]|jgi:hypothetical protein|nr:hypothetical protein [Burkholderiales bacterium]